MKRAMLTLTGVLVIGTSAHASIIYQLSTGGRPDSSDLLWRSSMAQLSGELKVGESESSKGRDPEGDQGVASSASSAGLLGVSGRLNGNGTGWMSHSRGADGLGEGPWSMGASSALQSAGALQAGARHDPPGALFTNTSAATSTQIADPPSAVVAEPGTLILTGSGLVLLGRALRRQRKRLSARR